MRWLIIQSDGEHKGQDGWTRNDYLRECHVIKHSLIKSGYEADIWGLRHDNYKEIPDFNSYDFIFCIENYEIDWIPDLSQFKKPLKLYWAIDVHCHDILIYENICKNFDIILNSTKSLIPVLEHIYPQKKHLWFPNAVDERYFDKSIYETKDKSIDLLFVGSKNPARKEFIEDLEKNLELKYYFATRKRHD